MIKDQSGAHNTVILQPFQNCDLILLHLWRQLATLLRSLDTARKTVFSF